MPYSNLTINPNAGSVSSFGGLDASQWSLGNATQNINNMTAGGSNAFGGMMSGLLSGGIGAAGSVLGSIINGIFAKKAAQRQFKNQVALMNLQNEMQRDMLTDEMALKMQGYKKAGLSTASLAGNFSNNTAVPSASASAPQASAQDFHLGDIFNAARQVKLQEDAIQSEIDLNNANADKARASAGLDNAESFLKRTFGDDYYEKYFANMDEDTRKKAAERVKTYQDMWNSIDITGEQVLNLQQERKNMEQLFNFNVKEFPKRLAMMAAKAYADYQAGNLSKANAKSVMENIENIKVERDLLKKRLKIDDKTLDMMEEQIEQLRLTNDTLGLEALKSRWMKTLYEEFGYDWWKAKQIWDGALEEVDKTTNTVNNLVSTAGNIATGGIAGNVGRTVTSTTTGPKGTFSTVTHTSPYKYW